MEKLLTVDEAAEALRVPRSWIYGRIHAKGLPFAHCHVGRYVRIPEAAIREYIEQQTVAPKVSNE